MAIKKQVGFLKVMPLALNFINIKIMNLGIQIMKKQLYTLTILSIIISITLMGCGEADDNAPKEIVEGTTPPPVLTPETINTSELVSEPDFDFISNTDVHIIIPASPSTAVRYFINICTDFFKENDEMKINYKSCKLRTALTTLVQPFTLSLSNAEVMLVAQIWPIEEAAQPITFYWNITESGNHWEITM